MDQLGLFAKFWQPGAVKTRLAKSMAEVFFRGQVREVVELFDVSESMLFGGFDASVSRLYQEFVVTLLARFREVADYRVLAFSPIERWAAFAALAGPDWKLEPQVGGDLGRRMQAYFHAAFARGASRVVLIGSDSPDLPIAFVNHAFELLNESPVVLGPAIDGGYYLVGLRREIPEIFLGIAWSSDRVWSETVARLRSLHCPFATLPAWYDVDDVADLRRLKQSVATCGSGAPALASLKTAIERAWLPIAP